METPAIQYPTITLRQLIGSNNGKGITKFADVEAKLSFEFADFASAEEKLKISLLGPDSAWFWESSPTAYRTSVLLFVAQHQVRKWTTLDEARNAITWENTLAVETAIKDGIELWNGEVRRARGLPPTDAVELVPSPLAQSTQPDGDGSAGSV